MAKDPEKQRAAKKRWYEKNKNVYLERNRRTREQIREMIRELRSVPCHDCAGTFPWYVMDFDHRENEVKLAEIGKISTSWGRTRILAEIAKCDVVCANCHRVRTHERREAKKLPHGA